MVSGEKDLKIERLDEYSDEMAAAIGRLMPFLSENASEEPIPEERLRAIIDSPDREQLLAVLEGKVVGSAVLDIIVGDLGETAWLEDFVTDPEVRGKGVGHQMWLEMLDWCREHGLGLMDFQSRYSRDDAHAFYRDHGARIRDTAAFRMRIPEIDTQL